MNQQVNREDFATQAAEDWRNLLLQEEDIAVADKLVRIHEQYLSDVKELHITALSRFEPELEALAASAKAKGNHPFEQQMVSILTKLRFALEEAEEGLQKVSQEKYRLEEEKGYLNYQREKLSRQVAHQE